MHLLLGSVIAVCVWKWADLRNWRKYQPTMLFVALANLLYNFVYHDHLLWRYSPGVLYYYQICEMYHAFIIMPAMALLFLTKYPDNFKGQILRTAKYIAVFITTEALFYHLGIIVYNYGWNLWWSLAWNTAMLPIWALHHKRPLLAYGVSAVFVTAVLILFPISFTAY